MSHPIDQFKASVKRLYPNISADAWDYLRSGLSTQSFPPKAYLIQAGQYQRALGFVASGLMRGFYINPKGEEITIRFVKEGEYATHYTALLTQQPSKYTFQCLEPTEVVLLPYAHVQEGYKRYAEFERFGRLIAEEVLKAQQYRIEQFQFDSAEQRYLNFIDRHPDLFNRVSLSHLSTYLGIKRPSLSRIRKQLSGQ